MICDWQRLGVLCIGLAIAGCNSRNYDGPERFGLTGEITYDGEIVDAGTISFIPTNQEAQRVAGGEIENGKYVVPEANGVNAGSYRVEIRWGKKTGKQIFEPNSESMVDERVEGLPKKFHDASTLTANVSAEQTKFDFHLKSK